MEDDIPWIEARHAPLINRRFKIVKLYSEDNKSITIETLTKPSANIFIPVYSMYTGVLRELKIDETSRTTDYIVSWNDFLFRYIGALKVRIYSSSNRI